MRTQLRVFQRLKPDVCAGRLVSQRLASCAFDFRLQGQALHRCKPFLLSQ